VKKHYDNVRKIEVTCAGLHEWSTFLWQIYVLLFLLDTERQRNRIGQLVCLIHHDKLQWRGVQSLFIQLPPIILDSKIYSIVFKILNFSRLGWRTDEKDWKGRSECFSPIMKWKKLLLFYYFQTVLTCQIFCICPKEQVAYDDPEKKIYHLCIVNLVIGYVWNLEAMLW
jgi:hypothetical protein